MPPNPQSKSEIDDIFSGKSKQTKSTSQKSAAQQTQTETEKAKVKKNKNKDDSSASTSVATDDKKSVKAKQKQKDQEEIETKGQVKDGGKEKKPKVVDQVLDPSISLSNLNPQSKVKAEGSSRAKRKELDIEDEEFRDSRGSKRE